MHPSSARLLFPVIGVAILLGGCTSSSSGANAPGFLPARTAGRHASGGRSWMSPDAKKRRDLLYVSDPGTNEVYVYSFPKGELVGALSGFDEPWGLCSDRAGDVFIADVWHERIVEYAHGGDSPIATLTDDNGHPMNCSVDRGSGSLAVTYYFLNDPDRRSEVAVYSGAQGTPALYTGSKISDGLWACTYDDRGNLFLDGTYGYASVNVGLAELPKGGSGLVDIALDTHIQYLSGVQWTGKYLAMADQSQGSFPATIYHLAISGTSATKVGSTPLLGTKDLEQFWVQRGRVAAPSGMTAAVRLYAYPAGGDATRTIDGLQTPFGVTVSRAAK